MNVNCPDCNKIKPKLLESRLTVRGIRRRRFECQGCRYRWTMFNKETEGREYLDKWSANKARFSEWRRLSPAQAMAIIVSPKPQRVLAKEYGVTRQTISSIQTGRFYKDIYLELYPPRTGPMIYCTSCKHWSHNRCGFGFPDAGDTFATECSVYLN